MEKDLKIQAKAPDSTWLDSYLLEGLKAAKPYSIPTPSVGIKLDQNESPWDWPTQVKDLVTNELKRVPWNRYPSPYADDLLSLVADYAKVDDESVMLLAGSNYGIGLILDVFGRRLSGKLVIARPSFSLYESHCYLSGLPYETWDLDENLEYDCTALPELPPGSLVLFASPNNPVGNALSKTDLEELLKNHPTTLFIADEAYFEFAQEPYSDLLATYSNMIILRTFSKTMGAAGLRLGYILGHKTYLDALKKLRLPFMLNHFTSVGAKAVLSDPNIRLALTGRIEQTCRLRDVLHQQLSEVSEGRFEVKQSQANFLLLRWPDQSAALNMHQELIKKGILIRNVSGAPGLAGCLRVTIGKEEENQVFLDRFKQILQSS